jgi:hypothetical protein
MFCCCDPSVNSHTAWPRSGTAPTAHGGYPPYTSGHFVPWVTCKHCKQGDFSLSDELHLFHGRPNCVEECFGRFWNWLPVHVICVTCPVVRLHVPRVQNRPYSKAWPSGPGSAPVVKLLWGLCGISSSSLRLTSHQTFLLSVIFVWMLNIPGFPLPLLFTCCKLPDI